ncbi:hypothetical protein NC651_036557 [Populus alba x Populus x berolinensis]|nr:hypothetical protein NC651_036557 [Populus alba x Populus x berolinensis]
MAERFKSVDKQPEEELLDDQSRFILGLWKSMSTLMLIALLQCHKHQPRRNQLDHLVLEDGWAQTLLIKKTRQPLLCSLLLPLQALITDG